MFSRGRKHSVQAVDLQYHIAHHTEQHALHVDMDDVIGNRPMCVRVGMTRGAHGRRNKYAHGREKQDA